MYIYWCETRKINTTLHDVSLVHTQNREKWYLSKRRRNTSKKVGRKSANDVFENKK